jgi:hypothetical protein
MIAVLLLDGKLTWLQTGLWVKGSVQKTWAV